MNRILKLILRKFGFEIKKIQMKSVLPAEEKFNVEEVQTELQMNRKILLDRYAAYLTFDDFTAEELDTISSVAPYTMTGPLRIVSLIRAVEYIIKNGIPGAFVECGVWKGGSMMVIAKTLLRLGVNDRQLFLYDTFEGMSEPTEFDISFDNQVAEKLLSQKASEKEDGYNIWCYSTIDEVKSNLLSTGYEAQNMHFLKGKVEETIPGTLPDNIALLRLDTDWYESTMHELKYLFPHVSKKGVIIVDDYGQWLGQKRAVDEYFDENSVDIFLSRIDFSSRLAIKCN